MSGVPAQRPPAEAAVPVAAAGRKRATTIRRPHPHAANVTYPSPSPSEVPPPAIVGTPAPLDVEQQTLGDPSPAPGDESTAAAGPAVPTADATPASVQPAASTDEPAPADAAPTPAPDVADAPDAADAADTQNAAADGIDEAPGALPPGDAPSDGVVPPEGQSARQPADLSPAASAARMAELFPALFSPGGARPLKLRIQPDIQQRAPGVFSRKALSIFLHRHTTSTAYLKALVNSPHRFDLDGNPAGEVLDEHREAARTELERRRALHDARRAAEREAQRAAHEEARRAGAAEADARRRRAELLRAFEASTLTPANFCALKGIAAGELDPLLALARTERASAPLPAPHRAAAPAGDAPGRPRRHGADAAEPPPRRRGRPRG